MKKENFQFLKTMASLENCIECVQDDVNKILIEISDDAGIDKQGISERARHLKYWFDHAISEFG